MDEQHESHQDEPQERHRLDSIAAAFEHLPFSAVLTEGDDQRVVAMSAVARAQAREQSLGAPVSPGSDLAARQLADRFREVYETGEPYVGREWTVERRGAAGQAEEAVVDLTVVPVREEDGRVTGSLGIGQDVGDRLRQRDRAAELERRAAAASGSMTYLQDAVLPKGLPVPQRVEASVRYLLAEDDAVAGGDWFDVIALPDGRVVAVVGDVVGHGVEASVVMGELRTLLDERVRVDGDIVAALELLDARSRRVRASRSTTLCVAVLDTASGELTYCTAGHPPPVLVGDDGSASYLPTTGAGPLGSGRGFPVQRCRLAEGDLLLLYSDGLIERPGRPPTQGTVELLQAAGAAVRGPGAGSPDEPLVGRATRRVLDLLTRVSGYADDITLLALQRVPPTPPLVLHLAAVPDTVRTVRSELGDWLLRLRVSELDRVALLHAVGELVSNVVAHAYDPVHARNPVDVRVELAADGAVDLEVSDQGRWRPVAPGAGGRGLALAAGFLDELRVEHGERGTCARGRHWVTHPAELLRGTSRDGAEPTRTAALAVVDDVIHLVGMVDLRSAGELRHACARASRAGTRPIVVNLTEVDLLSSAAVQALYDARAAGPVELVAPMGSPAQHVLELAHLPYRITPSVEA